MAKLRAGSTVGGDPIVVKPELDAHINRKDNPHGVTKDQVGLGNVDNVKQASKSEFDSHVADKNNPHGVTKSQVGLGNVENFGIATQSEAEAGTSNSKYMTPLRTKQAIDIHATRTDNPHGVTKAQVGLGNVDNVKQASKAEFDAHVADKNNPHGVTKAQVGLGNVENYSVASQAEAEAGTASNRYMTPQRTRQAIDAHPQLPTAGEKAALAGTSGTPSNTNRYVTNSDPRLSDARPPTAHTHNASDINEGVFDIDRIPSIPASKLPEATTEAKGIVQLTTSTSSTSTTLAATASAVKAAYDLANGRVPTSRTISAGDGLTGGGDLSANRTLSVDSTVVRTSGNQTISGTKTFSGTVVVSGVLRIPVT